MRRLCLSRARRCGILDHEFDALASLPARSAQMTSDVQSLPLALHEKLLELRAGDPKRTRFDAATVGGVQRAADMGLLNGTHAA